MRSLLKGLTLASVKDYVSIGAGLAAILGGLITGAAVFLGGDGSPEAAVAPASTSQTASPEPTPSLAPTPTLTPAPTGDFLRVQFGTQQDPATLLPSGTTASPGDDIEVCTGQSLYAWVYHSFEDGAVIDGRITDRAGVLFTASVTVAPGATHFWISAVVSEPGPHTVSVALQGGEQRAEWAVNVTCTT